MYTPFCFPCEFPMENGGESRRRSLLRAAEARLIASVPSCRAEDTVLPDGQHIHSLCLALDDEDPRALIMLGGYGLGAGMFCLVLDAFAKVRKNVPFGRVYALDWPGSGLCSPYEPLCDLADITLEQAIAFASDAMDGFLLAKGIAAPRVTLLGHSLGAYLAFCYCESRAARLPCAHLLLASCFGVPTLPAHRSPPWSEPEWLQKKASDLEQRKRARTLFDAGGPNSNRGIVRLVFGLLALCLPLLLLAGCIVRLSGKPNVKAKAARLASPVTTISARLGCAPLRWLLIRYVAMRRYMQNGQFDAAGVSVADFASYVFYKAEVGFGEFLYDRATVSRDDVRGARVPRSFRPKGLVFGTFWAKEPLGGTCEEIDFVDGEPPALGRDSARNRPFSEGRLQAFLRATTPEGFRASFFFGVHDWIDCRPVADIAREFPTSVNVATGGAMLRLPACGHQMMVDQPTGFVEAIITLCAQLGTVSATDGAQQATKGLGNNGGSVTVDAQMNECPPIS
jgi:pimeloyl-ACP methyl ester carboxylesterase